MKIVVDYKDLESDIEQLKIISAKYLSDYVIRLKFHDGIKRIVDFEPFLSQSFHTSIKKYLDKEMFSKFELVNGNLNWNDYDLIFPISDLYRGQISPSTPSTLSSP
ncbi:MAG: DUF2442 domain-containing protein [Bacteroidales bacterium]